MLGGKGDVSSQEPDGHDERDVLVCQSSSGGPGGLDPAGPSVLQAAVYTVTSLQEAPVNAG